MPLLQVRQIQNAIASRRPLPQESPFQKPNLTADCRATATTNGRMVTQKTDSKIPFKFYHGQESFRLLDFYNTLISHQAAFNLMSRKTKTKVSLTIDTGLLEWIDKQTKNFKFQSRSHAFEQAVYKLKKEMEKEKE
jgi:hypothetical protein